jgi:hypothetical protein
MSYEYVVKNEMPDGPRSSYLASCFLEIDLAVTLLDLDLTNIVWFGSRNPTLPIFFSES